MSQEWVSYREPFAAKQYSIYVKYLQYTVYIVCIKQKNIY